MSTRRSRGYAHLRRARSSFSAIFLVLTAASSRRWRRSSVVRRLMAGAAPSNTNTGLMLWKSNLRNRKDGTMCGRSQTGWRSQHREICRAVRFCTNNQQAPPACHAMSAARHL